MNRIIDNIASVCVLLLVVLFVFGLVRSLLKAKKQGKNICAGCSACALAGKCRGLCEAKTDKNSK